MKCEYYKSEVTPGLARRSPVLGLGIKSTRLEANPYRRGTRGKSRGSMHVAQASQGGRRPHGITPSSCPRPYT